MIRNNKELKRSLFLLAGICLMLAVCGFLHSSLTGLLVLAAGLTVCAVFLFTEISRYKKLQSFSEHLNELLQRGGEQQREREAPYHRERLSLSQIPCHCSASRNARSENEYICCGRAKLLNAL